jgi:ankyrin repeat protein
MLNQHDVESALATLDSAEEGHLFGPLCAACQRKEVDTVRTLLQDGADARYQNPETGENALMVAAASGDAGSVEVLLRIGVPWNAQDKHGRCAGDHALAAGHSTVSSRHTFSKTLVAFWSLRKVMGLVILSNTATTIESRTLWIW